MLKIYKKETVGKKHTHIHIHTHARDTPKKTHTERPPHEYS